jgi:predicted trehalose synthase
VIVEQLDPEYLPKPLRANPSGQVYQRLAPTYKQLNAPFGELSMASIKYATAQIQTDNALVYNSYLDTMANFTARRDALAAEIRKLLEDAAFADAPIQQTKADSLIDQAHDLIAEMKGMAAATH